MTRSNDATCHESDPGTHDGGRNAKLENGKPSSAHVNIESNNQSSDCFD